MLTRNLLYLATLFSLSTALPQAAGTTTSALASGCPVPKTTSPIAQSSASAPLSSTNATASGSATSVASGSATSVASGSATSVASGSATSVASGSTNATASGTISASSVPTTTSTSVPVTSVELHPNGNAAKCLDVKGNIRANGTPVQIFDCNGTPAQQWVIAPGEGHVILAGTNFCLDAGSTPANGVGMKIWECFANLPAQDWFYTADQRIALTGKGFCLDLTNGLVANSNLVQTWHCTTNDINQVWTTGSTSIPPKSTGVPITTAPPTTTIPITILPPSTVPTTTGTPIPVASVKLHPNGNAAKCLDVKGNIRANGTAVQIFDCNGTPAQQWVIAPGEGHVVLAGTNFCLDAGSAPANGVGMKIWECFSNLAAQDWFYTADKRIALTGKGFCLDLTDGLVANSNRVQTWHCTTNDANQVWSTGN